MGQPRGLGNYQISNMEEELKAQTRFSFKTYFKGTYKSQNLRKRKGFGNCGSCYRESTKLRLGEEVLSVQRAEAKGKS